MVSGVTRNSIPSSADLSKEPSRVRLTIASAAWYSAIEFLSPKRADKVHLRGGTHLGGPAAQSSFVVGVSMSVGPMSRTFGSLCSAALHAGGRVNQAASSRLMGMTRPDGHNAEAGSIAEGGHEPIGVDAMPGRSGLEVRTRQLLESAVITRSTVLIAARNAKGV